MRLTVYRRILEPETVPKGKFQIILKFLAEDVDLVSWFHVVEGYPGYKPSFREIDRSEANYIIGENELVPA